MLQIFAVAAGGAVGAVFRYWCSTAVYAWLGRDFPWGTLAVNLIGSLLMGILYVLLIERLALAPEWRSALMVGFLGAFTTFSTFALETLQLIDEGAWLKVILNIFVSVAACVMATAFGVTIMRRL